MSSLCIIYTFKYTLTMYSVVTLKLQANQTEYSCKIHPMRDARMRKIEWNGFFGLYKYCYMYKVPSGYNAFALW